MLISLNWTPELKLWSEGVFSLYTRQNCWVRTKCVQKPNVCHGSKRWYKTKNFWIYISLQLKYNFTLLNGLNGLKQKHGYIKSFSELGPVIHSLKLMPHMDIYTFGQLNFRLTRIQLALKALKTSEELSVKNILEKFSLVKPKTLNYFSKITSKFETRMFKQECLERSKYQKVTWAGNSKWRKSVS